MAQPSPYSTVLDIRNLSEYVTTQVRDNNRVLQFIHRADSIINGQLRAFYTIPTSLQATVWNGPPQVPFAQADQGITGNTGTGSLSDVTPGTSAIAEMWTITFTSATAFTVTASISGSQGSGTKSADFTSTNSYLVIPSTKWVGTMVSGDIFYVSVYNIDPTIVTISALIAAGLLLKGVYLGQNDSDLGNSFYRQGMDLLTKMTTPNKDGFITLDGYSGVDTSPEGVGYQVDDLGRDISTYADNEQTSFNDSTSGNGNVNFFNGRIW